MKTVELSAALGQAQVVENLKNFVGVDAQGAAALMTPERLAAVAGGILHPLVVKEYSYSLSIDADIVLESGIYLVNGWLEVKNYPATLKDSFATLIVLNYNNVVFQILTILNSKEILYRLKDNESWKSWS